MGVLVFWKVFIVFLCGLILGSFANVVIERGQKGEKINGRSRCDKCQKQLSWYDNIPVLSYVFLRGRCRQCGAKISWQYPAVELLFGVMFVLIAWRWGGITGVLDKKEVIDVCFYLLIGFFLLIIFIWDWRYMVIPDEPVIGGLVLTVAYFAYRYWLSLGQLSEARVDFGEHLWGAVAVGGFFYLLYVVSGRRWIGGGDIKLGFLLGFLVGWRETYFLLMIAYILGSVPAVYLLITGKATAKSKIPFGPFLVMSGFIMMFWGEKILHWWKM